MSTAGEKRQDLTRWNRGGLKRFQYIGGDAASWLEELRLSHLSQFLRGIEDQPRKPEFWRDIFSFPETEWPSEPDLQTMKAALSWRDLWQDFPDQPETSKKRNDRLLKRYHKGKSDQTFEISRAFARAVHVLLGHTNAYANEGYIRTATQWDNLKKLATMVGYFPAPAASATTVVGLTTKEGVRFETVAKGLGMKYSPSEGGAPIIFETLEDIVVHEDLNALRVLDWDKNPEEQDLTQSPTWLADGYKENLSIGYIVLILDESGLEKTHPTVLSNVTTNTDAEGKAESFTLEFEPAPVFDPPAEGDPPPAFRPAATDARLFVGSSTPRRGLMYEAPSSTRRVVEVTNAAQFMEGNIVAVREQDSTLLSYAVIEKMRGMRLLLTEIGLPENLTTIEIAPLTEFQVPGNQKVETSTAVTTLQYVTSNGRQEATRKPIPDPGGGLGFTFSFENAPVNDQPIKKAFSFLTDPPAIFQSAAIVQEQLISVQFEGSPPDGLIGGSWLVASLEDGDDLYAHEVTNILTEDKSYTVSFFASEILPNTDPEQILFYGPFAKALKLENHAWNSDPAIGPNGAVLEVKTLEAAVLLKTKRKILVENTVTKKVVIAAITEATVSTEDDKNLVTVKFENNPDLLSDFPKYQTVFRANALKTSHGETKPRKTLGSGNGEKPAQTFHFDEPEITFVPDPTSETGVRPDIDVEVGGVIWAWVGSILEAELELRTYTTTIREDGTLDVRFLTRLPTGSDNIIAARFRVGTGPGGNNVPPYSFSKPLKSSAFVKEIHQPLVPSGGAEREPVSAMRSNAPGHLKALGRAVSCEDFATLGARHSSVLKAREDKQIVTGKGVHVIVTILPADGKVASDTLLADVRNFIQTRAVPGISVTVEGFVPVPVPCVATILVDTAAYDIDLVLEAAEKALLENFSIINRELGQSLYIGNVLAVLENIEGVEAVRKAAFGADPDRQARTYFPEEGPFRTIHAKPAQILHLQKPGDIDLTPEALK